MTINCTTVVKDAIRYHTSNKTERDGNLLNYEPHNNDDINKNLTNH